MVRVGEIVHPHIGQRRGQTRQFLTHLAIGEDPGVTAAEVARRCLVTAQTMTTVLANLSDKAFVDRRPHPSIGQVQQTFLTPQGKRVLGKADVAAVSVEKRLVASLSSKETQQLEMLLERCIANLSID
jgi:DNA-binding MarR family transcriptional regulator